MITSLLDTILDRTVVAGYTSVGYRIRKGMWSSAELPSLEGKVVLVTGATLSPPDLAAAEGGARLGAAVWLLARSEERGERARQEVVARSGNRDIQLGLCDLSDLKAVRAFAARFSADMSRLDVLVNNAGALLDERTLSPDGIEMTFATNVLGPFLLTNLLTPLLKKSAPARIVNVSSGGMYTQRIHVEDPQSARGEFDGATAYARSKRAQVILTEQWAQRLEGRRRHVYTRRIPAGPNTPGLRVLAATLLRERRSGWPCTPWRAPTRSSGWAPRPSRHAAPAASGMTAENARRTACPGPRRAQRTVSGFGPSANDSAEAMLIALESARDKCHNHLDCGPRRAGLTHGQRRSSHPAT